jgi:GNAT superfamily N-acetyltransferase
MTERLHMVMHWTERPVPLPVPRPMTVREAARSDTEALATVFFQGHRDAGEAAYSSEANARTEVEATMDGFWGEMLWDASLVAVWDEVAVAATFVVADQHHGGLPLLAFVVTQPAVQRQGAAAALVTASLAALHDRGLTELHLAVLPDNPARCLYERLGFTLVG